MTRKPPIVVDKSDSSWHLDKKVPIAVILTILLQTGGIIWWGATASERLNALERKADLAAPQAQTQGDRLTRVETRLEAVQDGIAEIKSILRKEPPPIKAR